ncbi:type II secretion system F family protein [Kitasatospora sp. NA04385]|uniref:type II secretion system F family protein n=1 Tax=Kitasatospora sp. NA04385 TaxID=2742135 RepID=UPI001590A2D1|nr:type II secretion system F family protein [Kitasatospora sp. NA04385]QKW20307.1 type II secretion system F family protein [Kitasatospora sp. NA04385]
MTVTAAVSAAAVSVAAGAFPVARTYGAACAATLLGAAAGLVGGLLGTAWLIEARRRARRRPGAPGPARAAGPGRGGRFGRFGRARALWRRRRPRWLVPELLLLPLGAAVGHGTSSVLPLVGAACGVVPLRRWRAERNTARAARRRAAAVIDLCTGLAAELRSGATPEQAMHAVLTRAAPDWSRRLGAEPAARLAAGRYGADLPAALRLVAELPGGEGAAAMAACWRVSTESGTGLATGLEQVADALRAERALTEEISGELAGPRTTMALLAALPAVGLGLGTALGAHPVHVLLHTPVGLLGLLAGAALETAGILWTARIVRAAEDAPAGPATGGCGISRTRGELRAGAPPRLTEGRAGGWG